MVTSTVRAAGPPFHRVMTGLARDPLAALESAARTADYAVVRINLGLFRPYVVSRPEHLQRVLRDEAATYGRGGMLWRPLRRLFGEGLGSDGPAWAFRRRLIQPLFSAKFVTSFLGQLSQALDEGITDLDRYAVSGAPIDARVEMTRIIHRALIRVFFGDRISGPDADKLGHAITSAFVSLNARLLLPFVPDAVPMPGDRAFLRAGRDADEVVAPLVADCRRRLAGGDGTRGATDMVSLLCQARDEDGTGLDDQQVRDDVVSMFAGASETSAVTLTWLWVALDENPAVAAAMDAEIRAVVGTDRPDATHLAGLRYTKMVIQEVMRLYPVAWMIPREAGADDVIDGVRVDRGSTVLASPYLTHRMAEIWPDPLRFDPERFAPERDDGRHRFAYLPFGAGPHQCLGSHFFTIEAQLLLAMLLSRYQVRLDRSVPVRPAPAATLRPRKPVLLRLQRLPQ
jgi:cytochrome P450